MKNKLNLIELNIKSFTTTGTSDLKGGVVTSTSVEYSLDSCIPTDSSLNPWCGGGGGTHTIA